MSLSCQLPNRPFSPNGPLFNERLHRRPLTAKACALIVASFFSLPLSWAGSQSADVVVIGSGMAGLAAALSAHEEGLSVIVLEKQPTIGGNSLLSSGLYNAPDKARQDKIGVEDSNELFFNQTFEAGHKRGDEKLIRTMVEGAMPTLIWLEKFGIYFKDEIIQIYGGIWPRGHQPKISHGRGYINLLAQACQERGIPIKTNAKVTEFISKKNKESTEVTGVRLQAGKGESSVIEAKKAVVLASGGFTANGKLCKTFDPRLEGLSYTGSPSATGELLSQVEKIGGAVENMGDIQCNFGPIDGSAKRSGFHIDVKRHILVNGEGKRFINEDGLRDALRDAVLAQPGKYAYIILDSDGYQSLTSQFQQNGASGISKGYGAKADTLEDLAKAVGIPSENLIASIAQYNKAVDTKKDALGRAPWMLISKIQKPPFYASKATMAIHYTMGGAVIDEKARVLTKERKPIKGLLAAGEVTTGVHGSNRVGGNGVVDALVFGRIAGKTASNP